MPIKSTKAKQVVWLHSHFLYWMGGTKFVFEVAKRLKKSRKLKRLTLIVEGADKLAVDKYKSEAIELVSMDHLSSNSLWYWLFFPYWLLRDYIFIKKYFYQAGFDATNTTIISSMFPMNVLGAMLGFRHVQNCYEPFAFFYDQDFIAKFSFHKRLMIKILAIMYSWLDKWATKKASVVLTLNSVTKQLLAQTYGVKSFLTQAGVDSKLFKPFVSKQLKEKFKGKKLVIHSTDYTPVKGTDLVIGAMKGVVQANKNAHLLITSTIDNPSAKKKLQLLAQELEISKNIHFLGFVSIELLPQYYSLASVLVQGSFSGKSGTTSMALPVKEALAAGTPAIRPNVGGEDVVNGVSGFIIDPRNTKKMTDKILFCVNNHAQAKKMGAVGRKTILTNYTWENTAAVFEKYV